MVSRIAAAAVAVMGSTYALDSDILDYLKDVYVDNPKSPTTCEDNPMCSMFVDVGDRCNTQDFLDFCPIKCDACVAKPEGHEVTLKVHDDCTQNIALEHALVWSDQCQPDPLEPLNASWKLSCSDDILQISYFTSGNCDGVPAESDIEDGVCSDGVIVDIKENLCASPGDTFAPSKIPSTAPTSRPTMTDMPSASPSPSPTQGPSKSPSAYPTGSPSDVPSNAPTYGPTTLSPTISPSKTPTAYPTSNPSAAPTNSPTDPTARPTASPSVSPTPPTSAPTNFPSVPPTSSPSPVPSTACPSSCPSAEPTEAPTAPGAKKTGDETALERKVKKDNTIIHILIIAPLAILVAGCFFFIVYCVCMNSGEIGSQRSSSNPNKDLELANAESAAAAARAGSGKDEDGSFPRNPSLVGGRAVPAVN